MNMLSKYLSHITSSLYSWIVLWKAKLPFPSKTNPMRHRTGKCEAGLKTLVRSQEKARPRVVHRGTMEEETSESESEPSSPPMPQPQPPLSWIWSPSSPALQTTMLGDMIGTESGDCMITDVEELRAESDEPGKIITRRRERGRKSEFPPPMTLLRKTGEMPWSLEREYSGDGRLIIMAMPETVVRRGHEYCIMESHREDGRLSMRLAPEEDSDYCEECGCPDEEEDCGFEFEEELAKEASNDSERCGDLDLRECVTYDGPGEVFQLHSDSDPFLKGTGFGDLNTYLGRPASAPLRPMTPVM